MGKLFAKQPNGKFCQYSTVTDAFTRWNMSKKDLVDVLTKLDYGLFSMSLAYDKENTIRRLNDEIKSPSNNGRYLTPFNELLMSITMSNYEDINVLRNELKEMGYKQCDTFEPIYYMEGNAREAFMIEHFDEYIDILKKYIISEYNTNYFKTQYLPARNKTIEEFRNDVNNIKTLDDYKNFNIIYNDFETLEELVDGCKEINQHIDYDKVYEDFKKQLI